MITQPSAHCEVEGCWRPFLTCLCLSVQKVWPALWSHCPCRRLAGKTFLKALPLLFYHRIVNVLSVPVSHSSLVISHGQVMAWSDMSGFFTGCVCKLCSWQIPERKQWGEHQRFESEMHSLWDTCLVCFPSRAVFWKLVVDSSREYILVSKQGFVTARLRLAKRGRQDRLSPWQLIKGSAQWYYQRLKAFCPPSSCLLQWRGFWEPVWRDWSFFLHTTDGGVQSYRCSDCSVN